MGRISVKKGSIKARILGGLFGVILIPLVVFLEISENKKIENYVETTGIVVDYSDRYNDGSTSYAEIVEYVVDGNRYMCEADVYSSFPKEINGTLTVKYDANNPSACYVGKKSQNVILVIALIALGIAAVYSLTDGIIAFIKSKRQKI